MMDRNSEPPDVHSAEPEVEQVFEDFWRAIVMPDGVLDLAQVKRELHDFYHLLDNVPKVYDHITHSRITKPNTPASAVIGVHDEVCFPDGYKEAEAVCEALERHEQHGGSIPWPSVRKPYEAWKAQR